MTLPLKGKNIIARTIGDLKDVTPTRMFAMDIETHGKPVGSCPQNPGHGICGIALCNTQGAAAYMVIDDGRKYDGIPIKAAIAYLNKHWMASGAVVLFHNCKFDLGFLLQRGLDISRVMIRDSYLVHTIRLAGIFTSNKLKDIVRERFGIETISEEVIKKWLNDNETEDYGDLPIDIIGPYGCDDVRYTLCITLTETKLKPEERKLHDLYVRNVLHLIEAERRGLCVNIEVVKERIAQAEANLEAFAKALREQLGSAAIDPANEQEILAYLHARNLHSEPREYYGEVQYVLNREFMKAQKHELCALYLGYARAQKFLLNYSGNHGNLTGRLFSEKGDVGFHPSFLLSAFSRGGVILSKLPDYEDGVALTESARQMMVPRKGMKFISIKAQDLLTQLLAFYCQDEAALNDVGKSPDYLCTVYAARAEVSKELASLLIRRVVEGSGQKLFENRAVAAKVPFVKSRLKSMYSAFEASIPGFLDMRARIQQSCESQGFVRDRANRMIQIPADKYWRAHAILLASSYGNILSTYFDPLCKVMKATGAHLVFAHRHEFLFECEEANQVSAQAAAKLLGTELVTPVPKWMMKLGETGAHWTTPWLDATDLVTSTIWGD